MPSGIMIPDGLEVMPRTTVGAAKYAVPKVIAVLQRFVPAFIVHDPEPFWTRVPFVAIQSKPGVAVLTRVPSA